MCSSSGSSGAAHTTRSATLSAASQASVAGLLHRARRSLAASLSGAGKKVMVALPVSVGVALGLRGQWRNRDGYGGRDCSRHARARRAAAPRISQYLGRQAATTATPAITGASTTGGCHFGTTARRLLVVPAARPSLERRRRSLLHLSQSTLVLPSGGAAPSAETASKRRSATPISKGAEGVQEAPVAGADGHGRCNARCRHRTGPPGAESVRRRLPRPSSPPVEFTFRPWWRRPGTTNGNGVAGAKAQGNGPPSNPGSGGNGVAGAKAQGNGPPSDPGSQGNGQAGAKAQGQRPAAPIPARRASGTESRMHSPAQGLSTRRRMPDPQANGHANDGPNGNANGLDNGNGQGSKSVSLTLVDHGAGNGGGGNPHDG